MFEQFTLFNQPDDIASNKVVSYHQTTSLTAEQKSEFEEKAKGQEEKILEWFRSNPDLLRSPSQILGMLFDNKVPLTSVRRAMSNLAHPNRGLLRKTDLQITGEYGRPEHLWRLNK